MNMSDQLADEIYGLHCDIGRLENENAELLEFASEAWELLTCNEPDFVWSGLQERARELGVEVDV